MTDKLFDDELSSKSDGEDQYIDLHKNVVASNGKEVPEESATQEEAKEEVVHAPEPEEQTSAPIEEQKDTNSVTENQEVPA